VFAQSWPDVEAYDGPTLLVQGTDDPLPSHAGRLAGRARADLRWLSGDHYVPVDDPETFTAVVARFCADVYGDPAVPVEAPAERRERRLRAAVQSVR
jgi:pimeloyl-ACP methyl ester carboxylesterase